MAQPWTQGSPVEQWEVVAAKWASFLAAVCQLSHARQLGQRGRIWYHVCYRTRHGGHSSSYGCRNRTQQLSLLCCTAEPWVKLHAYLVWIGVPPPHSSTDFRATLLNCTSDRSHPCFWTHQRASKTPVVLLGCSLPYVSRYGSAQAALPSGETHWKSIQDAKWKVCSRNEQNRSNLVTEELLWYCPVCKCAVLCLPAQSLGANLGNVWGICLSPSDILHWAGMNLSMY